MSADNGIYVLHTTDGYRVTHGFASDMETINRDPTRVHARFSSCAHFAPNVPYINKHVLWCLFYRAPIVATRTEAMSIAYELAANGTVLEYGICELELPIPFPTKKEAIETAMDYLEWEIGSIENDDTPVPSRLLYSIRFALMDVLSILSLTSKTENG